MSRGNHKTASPHQGLAICQFALRPDSNEIQLTPVGRFRAKDGRPFEVKEGWHIDAAVAEKVLQRIRARRDRYVIDYEHQTIYSRENGQPAPAAGWYLGENVQWREGVGLVATNVKWTDKASAAISANEYAYISPVLIYNKQSGEVIDILMAAVTNYAAIDGMADIYELAAAHFDFSLNQPHTEEPPVNELLLAMLKAIGVIKADATIEDVKTVKHDDVVATLTTLQQNSASLTALRATLAIKEGDDINAAIVALKAGGEPDPAKFVGIDVVKALQGQVAALNARITGDEVADLVNQAVADGKLLPALTEWATRLGNKDVAELRAYIEGAPTIAALKGSQTGGKTLAGNNEHNLTDQQMAICKDNGIDPKDYAATLKAEQDEALAIA